MLLDKLFQLVMKTTKKKETRIKTGALAKKKDLAARNTVR